MAVLRRSKSISPSGGTKNKHGGSATANTNASRLDQRRRERAREKRRPWALAVFVILGFGVVLIGVWMLLHSALFSARTIAVHGASSTDAPAVIRTAGLSGHPPLISINPSAVSQRIEQLPWVASARVQRRWPTTVVITVVPRVATAYVKTGAPVPWALVDASGHVIARVPGRTSPPLVTVWGSGLLAGRKGTIVPERALQAIVVASTLPPAFKGQVRSVEANLDGTVTLQLTSPITVNLGTTAQLTAKYEDIASVLAGATLHPGDVLDVSVPQASTITGP